jgi:hypothetical protein
VVVVVVVCVVVVGILIVGYTVYTPHVCVGAIPGSHVRSWGNVAPSFALGFDVQAQCGRLRVVYDSFVVFVAVRSLGALLWLSVYHLLNSALLVLLGVVLAHGVHDVELWQRGAFVGTCVTAPLSLKEHALRN